MFTSRLELTMEGAERAIPIASRGTGGRAAAVGAWARGRLTTTPGKLVLISVLLVAGAVSFGAIASVAERSRAQAAQAAATQTEPLLLQSVFLYTRLSDANATATTTFLQGGVEPPARLAHYLVDLRAASGALATLTGNVGASPETRPAVVTITEQLPVYTGLVEAARANNRQGFPIGAAYLRQASTLLTGKILPQANHLYATEAKRLSDDYAAGTSPGAVIVLAIVVVLAVGSLVAAQIYLARMSRRILNVPMVAATVLVVAVSIWAVAALIAEQNALGRARRSSDSVEVLSASRVLLSRAQSDQSLILANRGSDETDPGNFTAVVAALSPPGGLLGEIPTLSGKRTAGRLDAEFAAYRSEAAKILALGNSGKISQASRLGASSPVAALLDADLGREAAAAQRRFADAASSSTSSLSGLSIAIPVLAVLGCALALVGVRQRLEEYR